MSESAPHKLPHDALEATIFGERVYVLYGNAALGQAVNVIIAFAIAGLAWDKVDPLLVFGWLGAALLIALIRTALAMAFKQGQPGVDTLKVWYWRFFAGVVVTGLQWGTAGILFFIPGDPPAQTVLLIIFAGLTAGAVPVLAASREIYFSYCVLTLLPLGVMMSIQDDLGMNVVAMLDIVFMVAMMAVAHRYHLSLTNALRLGFENEALARQIREDKDRIETANVDLQQEVAARRRTQQELEKAKASAEASARAQGRVVANASEDLREPLNGIIGLASVALTERLPDAARSHVEKILGLARSLAANLDGILDITEIESGTLSIERSRVRLPAVLHHVRSTYAALAADKGLALSVFSEPSLQARVLADAARVEEILAAYVDNAVKFTDRGSVTIDARVIARSETRMTVRFSVRDTGIGLSPEQQTSVFSQPGPAVPGAPEAVEAKLGLSLCRRLAAAMGGRVGAEGEPGKGSQFWVELPFELAPDADAAEEEVDTNTIDLQGLGVLVADNDRVTQLVLRTVLERRGVKVVIADDGREALNIALDKATRLDAVFIDLEAPGVDGRAFAGKVRQSFPPEALSIYAITDGRHPMSPEACRALGLDGCLVRPLDPVDLLVAACTVVQQRQEHRKTAGKAPQ